VVGPKLVVGDFNEWTRGLATTMLTERLHSVILFAHLKKRRTYPGFFPFLHLDHIYYDGAKVEVRRVELPRTRRTLITSESFAAGRRRTLSVLTRGIARGMRYLDNPVPRRACRISTGISSAPVQEMRTKLHITDNPVVVLLGAALMCTAACGRSSNPSAPTAPTTATVSAVTVTSGSRTSSTIQLAASARMSDGNVRDVTNTSAWQSSNSALATVSSAGLVTFFGSGDVDVRATYQNVSGTLHLVVANVPVISMTISGAPSSPAISFQMTASARLADGSTQDVTRAATWESSNTSIATVTGRPRVRRGERRG
jgi:hypothetical protein